MKHRHALFDDADPTCRLCHNGEETALHLLEDCDAMYIRRAEIQATTTWTLLPYMWSVDQLSRFLEGNIMGKLLNPNYAT